ncbi:MAG TPA: tRNA (adenosine(37)-N6)-threonylcarbamoyltransferase complex dimerization subunit type 1 TsaB [Chitinophagales bacterium]|nr:tRNA (adenosine(37)-N6)-threonylcarbamoyltransferase complex dimerization subunit type 1 TsaB [Chitinophagales bacterium]
MALILNIETSSSVCSVCISRDREVILKKEDFSGTNHASMLAVFIQQLFQETKIGMKDLDAIAVSAGPGSYTGLRIGVVTAKGLCFSLDKPLIAIDSLQALASGLEKKIPVPGTHDGKGNLIYCPTIDARRNEIYFGLYGREGEEILPSHNIILSSSIPFSIPDGHTVVAGGSGVLKCRQAWGDEPILYDDSVVSSARHMTFLSQKKFTVSMFEDIHSFEPHYIKPVYINTPRS